MNTSLPAWLRTAFGAEALFFQIHPTPLDGNCFFSAMKRALDSIGLVYTIEHLRSVTAYPILDSKDLIASNTLKTWYDLVRQAIKSQDLELLTEYKHVLPIAHVSNPLSIENRKLVAYEMMNKQFWAEEHCIRVLERRLEMRVLVLEYDFKYQKLLPHHALDHGPASVPQEYYTLFLLTNDRGKHYENLSYTGQFVIHVSQLPICIRQLFHLP